MFPRKCDVYGKILIPIACNSSEGLPPCTTKVRLRNNPTHGMQVLDPVIHDVSPRPHHPAVVAWQHRQRHFTGVELARHMGIQPETRDLWWFMRKWIEPWKKGFHQWITDMIKGYMGLYNYDIINKAMWKSRDVSPSFTRIKWFTCIVFVFIAEHINCTQTHTYIIINK